MKSIFYMMVIAFACLSETATADPFSILFGDEDEKPDVSFSRQPGRDDLNLIELKLRDIPLDNGISAYKTRDGICVPLEPLFESLEFPINISEDIASGWYISPSRHISIDFSTGYVVQKDSSLTLPIGALSDTPSGKCLSLSALSKIFPIDFSYDRSTLTMTATPHQTLPLEDKLERAYLRKQHLNENTSNRPDYLNLPNPYRWMSLPSVDVDLSLSASRDQSPEAEMSIEMAADLLKMTAYVRSTGRGSELLQSLQFGMGRQSESADQLGLLKARKFAIGDIYSPNLPLLKTSGNGRGFIVSNRHNYEPSLFDSTIVQGPLPPGWEAELYYGEQLIAFVSAPNSNGEYVFRDVPLRPGYNRLTVKLYGPFGEFENRVIKQFVGSEMSPENELNYTIGYITPRKRSTEGDIFTQTDLVPLQDEISTREPSPYIFSSFDYGISDRISVGVDSTFDLDQRRFAAMGEMAGTFFGTYGVFRLAGDGTQSTSMEAIVQRRLSERTFLNAGFVDYGGLQIDTSVRRPSTIANVANIRLDTGLGRKFGYAPLQIRAEKIKRLNGQSSLNASARIASNFRGTKWSHNLNIALSGADSDIGNSIKGTVLAARNIEGLRVRGGLTYGLNDPFSLENVSVSVQKRLSKNQELQFSGYRDMRTGKSGVSGQYSRLFKDIRASTWLGGDTAGSWSAGVSLSFSLYSNPDRVNYKLGQYGIARTGALNVRTFDDLNDDGVFGLVDRPIEGAKFIVGNSLRSEQSQENGDTKITGLEPSKATDIELQLSSIDDPFLRPVSLGRAVTVRPGQVLNVDIPLTMSGDIDGKVLISRKSGQYPLSGVNLEVVDSNGIVVGQTQSEYDGYYYLDGLPATALTIRMAEKSLIKSSVEYSEVAFELTRKSPSRTDVDIILKDTK